MCFWRMSCGKTIIRVWVRLLIEDAELCEWRTSSRETIIRGSGPTSLLGGYNIPLEWCFQDLSNGILHAQNCQILSSQTEKTVLRAGQNLVVGSEPSLGGYNIPLERCFQDLSNGILHAQNCQILSSQTEKTVLRAGQNLVDPAFSDCGLRYRQQYWDR